MKKSNHGKRVLLCAMALLVAIGTNSAQAVTSKMLTEKNINQVTTVKRGTQVSLTLHSMYWELGKQSKSSSLTLIDPPASQGCSVVGGACGSQTWKFIASKVGIAHLIATRMSCGEAMRCTGTDGRFEVTVKVSR